MTETPSRAPVHEPQAQGTLGDVLLKVDDMRMYFPIKKGVFQRTVGHIKAVDGISFAVRRGETLGMVGESGCGKSTTGRAILQLYRPTTGHVWFKGQDLTTLKGDDLRRTRRDMQMIFQDPFASLNPRKSDGEIIVEPCGVHIVASGNAVKKRNKEQIKI